MLIKARAPTRSGDAIASIGHFGIEAHVIHAASVRYRASTGAQRLPTLTPWA
jgi:hypothetical protein